MKKIPLAMATCLCATQLFAISLMDFISGDMSLDDLLNQSGFSSSNELLSKAGQCVQPNISNLDISDICKLAQYSLSASSNVCKSASDVLNGLNIKGLNFSSGGSGENISADTSSLVEYCNSLASSADAKVKDVVDKAKVWATQNIAESGETNIAFPNGLTYEEFYGGNSAFLNLKALVNDKDNIISPYYMSKDRNHQATARYLIDLTKTENIGNAKDTTGVPLVMDTQENMVKLGVPGTMIDFDKKVNQYEEQINNSFKISSPQTLSSTLDDTLPTYKQTQPQDQANTIEVSKQVVAPILDAIDKNARVKKGVLKELYSSDEDLAVPTAETLQMYDESVRPKYAMLIQKQQMREAYINSLVDNETKTKKDIVELERRKAVIMKSQFDEEAAKREIDALIK